ncbi:MAG TPA: sec-independent translocase [Jatrophihabitans sp.]|nr:sec-independent translocase [Jatrophihabitans sp.]
MFNIGPLEFVVLAAVALIVFGPDKLPQLAKDAARMLRTLRDIAQGARSQLNSELGPEFADFDLSSLNPRTAIKNALLGEDELRPDLSGMNPREAIARAWRGDEVPPVKPVDLAKSAPPVDLGKPAEPRYEDPAASPPERRYDTDVT